ncbi:MAG: ROK family protein [Patescibacteria group bacterium]|nr:ROK family protein [Patescibacteria group bacterium]
MSKQKKQYTIGIDIGGTKMSAVLFDGQKVVADYTMATPKDTLEHFLVMLKALIEPLEEKAKKNKIKIKGVGLGVPSVLDLKRENILTATNLEIINRIKLVSKIIDFIDLPVVMDNDAYCFIRAEAQMGAAKGLNNVFGITLGTGIGGGWWYNNNVYRGAYGGAAQIWRTIIDIKDKIWLEEAYHRLAQNNPGKLSQEAVLGDSLAQRAYAEMGNVFGVSLANIANTIDPEAFVIGGSVIQSADLFFPQLKKTMKANIDSPESVKKIKVLKSKLGPNANAIGAALLVE